MCVDLSWVFVESVEWQMKLFPETEITRRSVYWHDRKRTSLLLRTIVDAGHEEGGFALLRRIGELVFPGRENSEARDLLFFHGAYFAKNFTNIGRIADLSSWISQLLKEEVLSEKLGSLGDGYVPRSRKMSVTEAAVYEADLKLAVTEVGFRFVSASTEHGYRQLAEEVRKAGATPIFLVTPLTMQIKLGFRPESGIAGPILW